MADRFETCWPFVLAQECPFPKDWSNPKNFSNDKHDPGGETMCGITQREYDHYRKWRLDVCRDVRMITETEGDDIYRNTYWQPHCPQMSAGLDLQFFDSCVNMGCTEAVRILQRVLGIEVDGSYGPHTVLRVGQIPARDIPSVIRTFTDQRIKAYRLMPGFVYFGRGWLARADSLEVTALKMAMGEP